MPCCNVCVLLLLVLLCMLLYSMHCASVVASACDLHSPDTRVPCWLAALALAAARPERAQRCLRLPRSVGRRSRAAAAATRFRTPYFASTDLPVAGKPFRAPYDAFV